MSLVDILTNPPDHVFYMATFFAFILSVALVWYACKEERCSDFIETYYIFIYTILGIILMLSFALVFAETHLSHLTCSSFQFFSLLYIIL